MSVWPGDFAWEEAYEAECLEQELATESFQQQVEEYNKDVIDKYLRENPKPISSITPKQLMQSFSDYLTNNPRTYQRALNIKGIYQRGSGTLYNGYYYDILKEESSDFRLKIYIPLQLRNQLQPNNLVILRGFISKSINNSSSVIELTFTVSEIASKIKETAISQEDEKRMAIIQRKTSKGFAPVESILRSKLMKGEKPKVYFQFPPVNDTSADVQACIKAAEASIDITSNNSVPFTRADLLCQQLRSADTRGYDVICLIRGGGSGLEVLDNPSILECLGEMRTPTIGAIGHAPDKKRYFVMSMFDLNKETPSALGQYLNDLVQSVVAERNNSLDVLTRQIEERVKEQIKRLSDDKSKLEKELNEGKEATKKLVDEKDKALRDQVNLTQQISELKINMSKDVEKAVKEQMAPLKEDLSNYKRLALTFFVISLALILYLFFH